MSNYIFNEKRTKKFNPITTTLSSELNLCCCNHCVNPVIRWRWRLKLENNYVWFKVFSCFVFHIPGSLDMADQVRYMVYKVMTAACNSPELGWPENVTKPNQQMVDILINFLHIKLKFRHKLKLIYLKAITIIIIKGSLTFLHFRMNCHHGGDKTQHQVETDIELIGLTARWLEKKHK